MADAINHHSQVADDTSIGVRYDQSTVMHTAQFMLSAGDEELVIDCSSGMIVEGSERKRTLPIHSRLALPWSVARQLGQLLQQVLEEHDRRNTKPAVGCPATSNQRPQPVQRTRLPKLGNVNV